MRSHSSRAEDHPGWVALVSGCDISGYGIVRSLGRAGVPSFVISDSDRDFGRLSKYCKGQFPFPDIESRSTVAFRPVPEDAPVIESLLAFARKCEQPPVLFATSDWFTSLLANHREELSPYFRYHWLAPETFATMCDKARVSQFCSHIGMLAPRTCVLQSTNDVNAIIREISFPCILKPYRSFHLDLPMLVGRKVLLLDSAEELRTLVGEWPELLGTAILQELIEGKDDHIVQCTVLIGHAGEPRAISTVRKLNQFPVGFGSLSYGRTEEIPEVIQPTLRFLEALGYHGLASLEFKQRASDGRFYFIEMNPRLPWYNGLFAEAGINLPYLAYLDLIGAEWPTDIQARQYNYVYWSSLESERNRCRQAASNGLPSKTHWALSTMASQSHSWLDWRDPKPFLRFMLHAWKQSIKGNFRRTTSGYAAPRESHRTATTSHTA